jgi:hypothetical protein
VKGFLSNRENPFPKLKLRPAVIKITLSRNFFPRTANLALKTNNSGCPRIEKKDKMNETGEYKIRPCKGFRDGGRGEPCVHPAFSDSLNLPDPNSIFPIFYHLREGLEMKAKANWG